ncbi:MULTISPECIES: hypothetical protein [Legionella]|uniref:Uncharacterized protein n=1 Tax=Legionella drozanskii LLAP-1 TaxID=1212489 RepID=A0A0W0SV81_9GAMM|nr:MULTISPECIES: hypothetical protein [Legionella]KTC87290.1 hypothetical protein Ldro_0909 [Legionella drozanskii LLAP-1]PJE17922.1 MAG: hypothetical protein CK430_01385 [Legionella sp.]
MKNSLTEIYHLMLGHYKFSSYRQERIAIALSKDLPHANSIKELHHLLCDYLQLLNGDCCSFLADLIPVSVFSFFAGSEENARLLRKRGQPRDLSLLISSWVGNIETQISALERLKAFYYPKQTEALVNLIFELLETPKALMHLNMLNLIKRLNSNDLEDALVKLAKLPPALEVNKHPSESKRPGNYCAQITFNKNHAACIKLLANNAAAHRDEDRLLALTNSLLQDALIIYKDLHTPEVTLVQSQTIEEQTHTLGCG